MLNKQKIGENKMQTLQSIVDKNLTTDLFGYHSVPCLECNGCGEDLYEEKTCDECDGLGEIIIAKGE